MSGRLDHVGLSVTDMGRAIAFYQRMFGLEPMLRAPFSGSGYERILDLPDASGEVALLRTPDNRIQIELFRFEVPHPVAPKARRAVCDIGISHFCIEVEEVDREYARLSAAGVVFHCPPINFGGIAKAVYGRDPDGNVFELWEALL